MSEKARSLSALALIAAMLIDLSVRPQREVGWQ